ASSFPSPALPARPRRVVRLARLAHGCAESASAIFARGRARLRRVAGLPAPERSQFGAGRFVGRA
ncbi:hypothetical protein AU476_35025, partial [Cupriavidus sp. UYMSc13B]